MQPTLIEVDDPGAEIAQEEVFAPVCALLRAADADHAVAISPTASARASRRPSTPATSTACWR